MKQKYRKKIMEKWKIMNFGKLEAKFQKEFPTIAVREEGGCVVLRGELDKWSDIYRAGTLAVELHSKGVINDIKLKGFVDKIQTPSIRDAKLEGQKPDVLVIGAGVAGSAVARELAKLDIKTLVVEKAGDVAVHTSSRNDGCVHVGIDLHKNQQKYKYCLKGNAMFDELSKELDIDFQRYAQIVIFSKWYEKLIIGPGMRMKAKSLGIPGVELISGDELRKREKNAPDWAIGAAYLGSAGVVSPYKLTVALAESAASNGVQFCFHTIVESMEIKDGQIVSVKTNRGNIQPKIVINCAGIHSDEIAEMAGDRTFTIHPRKGVDLILDKKKVDLAKGALTKSPFHKLPEEFNSVQKNAGHTKGGCVLRTIDGNILVGPSAEEVPNREDYTTSMDDINHLMNKFSYVSKGLSKADIITYFAGTRAATYEEDFVVRKGEATKNIIEVAGIQSPGLTAAPAIAVDVQGWVKEMLGAKENTKFVKQRKSIPHLASMSIEERDAFVKSNPLYGEIICRCEEISKGEIIDAIHNPLGVATLDSIKRRVRPGMGRCQGGFCSPFVVQIIANETGCSVEEVLKGEEGSNILYAPSKHPEKISEPEKASKTTAKKVESETVTTQNAEKSEAKKTVNKATAKAEVSADEKVAPKKPAKKATKVEEVKE